MALAKRHGLERGRWAALHERGSVRMLTTPQERFTHYGAEYKLSVKSVPEEDLKQYQAQQQNQTAGVETWLPC
jgi:hypothetical protein